MHIPHQINNHTTHYHSFHTWFPLFELKNVTIYWRSPKGILEIGKTGSVEFGRNVPNPLASSYRTFTLPKESKCCIYIRDKWRKSSGIESLWNAVACSLSNSLSKVSWSVDVSTWNLDLKDWNLSNTSKRTSPSPVSTYMNQLLTTQLQAKRWDNVCDSQLTCDILRASNLSLGTSADWEHTALALIAFSASLGVGNFLQRIFFTLARHATADIEMDSSNSIVKVSQSNFNVSCKNMKPVQSLTYETS